MMIKVKYFGLLAEITHCQEESFQLAQGRVSDLLSLVNTKYPQLKAIDFRLAQNQILAGINDELDGTEIAFLPPFAGG